MKDIAFLFVFASFIWQTYWLDIAEKENKVLTKDLQTVIAKHNAINHKLIKANERIKELEDANTQMMRVCNPSAINIAIKATKLPPLKGC